MSKAPCDMEHRCTGAIAGLTALISFCKNHKKKNWMAVECFYQNWIESRAPGEALDVITFMNDHKFYYDTQHNLQVRAYAEETSTSGEIHWHWYKKCATAKQQMPPGTWRRIQLEVKPKVIVQTVGKTPLTYNCHNLPKK